MKKLASAVVLVVVGAAQGFPQVASLRPLVESDSPSVVFEPALLGKWVWDVEFTRDGKNGYEVTVLDQKFAMRLVKFAGILIGDLRVDNSKGIPSHAFVKLQLDGDKLHASIFETDWLKQEIQNRGRPRHEVIDDWLILTATTQELSRDLAAYFIDLRSWSTAYVLDRVK